MFAQDNLIEAILSGHLAVVKQILNNPVDLEELDEYGFTPLIEATIANQLQIAALLLEKGAAVNNQDATGRTALHWAVDNANISICDLLLRHGANANAYTYAGQSILVLPYLRNQEELKKLLYHNKAKVSFAQDFIQVKLLGHRYALSGQADIIDPQGQFVAVDYEGFFLEFVIEIVRYSLERYCNHFMARPFQDHFVVLKKIIQLFQQASQLLQYQKYTIDIQQIADQIDPLLETELLLLPIAYEGHAISLVRYKDFLIRCDRGAYSQREGSIVIYRMQQPERWTKAFIKELLYQKQSEEFITEGLRSFLGLKYLKNIPIEAQLVGNCSWANIEGSVLALLSLLRGDQYASDLQLDADIALTNYRSVYDHWLQWDQARALEECVKNFQYANEARKATIAMLLGAVLFQSCHYQSEEDLLTVRKLMPILTVTEYQYVLKSYLKIYWYDKKTEEGYNLTQLLHVCNVIL